MKSKPAISPWFWGWTLLLSTLCFGSCDDDIQCQKAEIEIRYVGYTLPELDTIIVRRYAKPYTAGKAAKDSTVWSQPIHVNHVLAGDTARSQWTNSQQPGQPLFKNLESALDYEIRIPATGRIHLVTNIIENQTSIRRIGGPITGPKQYCMNPIQQLSIDGNPLKPDQLYGIFSLIYLNK